MLELEFFFADMPINSVVTAFIYLFSLITF